MVLQDVEVARVGAPGIQSQPMTAADLAQFEVEHPEIYRFDSEAGVLYLQAIVPDEIEQDSYSAALHRLEEKRGYVVMHVSFVAALSALGALQLALRHPLFNGPSSQEARRFAHILQRAFDEEPVLAQAAALGWREDV